MSEISRMIPLLHYEDGYWVLTDWSLAVLFELKPWPGAGRSSEQFDRAASALASFLESEVLAGTVASFSVSLYPIPNPDLVSAFQSAHGEDSEIARSRLEALQEGVIHRTYHLGITLPWAVKKKLSPQEFQRRYDEARKRMDRIVAAVPRSLDEVYAAIKPLDFRESYIAWKRMINGDWQVSGLVEPTVDGKGDIVIPDPPARQLVLSDASHEAHEFEYRGMIHRTYSLQIPPTADPERFWAAMMRYAYPGRIVIHCHIPESRYTRERQLKTERALARFFALGRSREHNTDKAAAIDDLLAEVRRDNARLFDLSGFAVVSGTSNQEVAERADALIAAYGEMELEWVFEAIYAPKIYFCWGLPGIAGNRPPASRRYVMSSRTVARMLPVYADFTGDPNPVILFRNQTGSVAGFSPISTAQAKWGGLIVAPSGSGKTFLANTLLYYLDELRDSPYLAVIDLALKPSYHTLVSSLGGTSILLDPSSGNTINPFEFAFPYNAPPERHLAFLKEVFLPSLMDGATRVELQFIERTLRRMYRFVLDDFPKVIELSDDLPRWFRDFSTWLEARDYFVERYTESRNSRDLASAIYAHTMAMPTVHDFLDALADPENALTRSDQEIADSLRRRIGAAFGGVRGQLFGGPTSLDIHAQGNDSLIYFYFGELVNYKDLLVTAFLVAYHYIRERTLTPSDEERAILERVYGRDEVLRRISRHKVYVVDEVHNLNISPHAMREIERAYRQGRTLGLCTLAITQGLRELGETEAGKAVIENAAMIMLLRHSTPEAPNLAGIRYVRETLGLTPSLEQLLKDLKRTDRYSEILVLSEGIGAGVLRYEPTPYERWIATTHNVETAVRDEIVRELTVWGYLPGEAMRVAAKGLAQTYPLGIAHGGHDPGEVKRRVLDVLSS